MVHQYKLNGYNIVLDTCSGSVHVVDEVVYDMIEMYEQKSKEQIKEELLVKYSDREDVTPEELAEAVEKYSLADASAADAILQDMLPGAREQAAYMGEDFYGFSHETICSVQRADSQILSVRFAYDAYTSVGTVSSPMYLNMQRGSTSIGSGAISAYAYIPMSGIEQEIFTEINLTLPGDHKVYTDAYDNAMDRMAERLEVLCAPLAQKRYETVIEEAEREYADGMQEYLDGMAEYRSEKADAEQKLADALAEKENVEIKFSTLVTAYVTDEASGALCGLCLKNAETGEESQIKVDGAFLAVGLVPENEAFAQWAALNDWGYFDSQEDCLTATPGVFVAGDCRSKRIRQVVTAASDGATAATAACAYLDQIG